MRVMGISQQDEDELGKEGKALIQPSRVEWGKNDGLQMASRTCPRVHWRCGQPQLQKRTLPLPAQPVFASAAQPDAEGSQQR